MIWNVIIKVFYINYLIIILFNTKILFGINIDNEIVGEPDIECLQDEIRVWVRTRKPFSGRIYTKGKADVPECSEDGYGEKNTRKPNFSLGFGDCGMRSLRSLEPRGMYYGVTIVVSFHPMFITKIDQAFHVKCFFEEANKGLNVGLDVSMMPTTEIEARHGIPGCTYSIHRSSIEDLDAGKPAGPTIQFARIGDKVLHQWHCDDQSYGILINNCYVTDGFGKKAPVIDSKGCPVDPILVTGIRYSKDLQRGYAESQVFKFADKPGVWFFCQIQMCLKTNDMCRGITPPSCATVSGTIDDVNERYNSGERASPLKSFERNLDYNEFEKTSSKRPEENLSNIKSLKNSPFSISSGDYDDYDPNTSKYSNKKKTFDENKSSEERLKKQQLSSLNINQSPIDNLESGSLVKQSEIMTEYETKDDLQRTTMTTTFNTLMNTRPSFIHGEHITSTTSSSQESFEDISNNSGDIYASKESVSDIVDINKKKMLAHGVPLHFKRVFDKINLSKEKNSDSLVQDRTVLMDGFHDLLQQMRSRKIDRTSGISNEKSSEQNEDYVQSYKHRRINKIKKNNEYTKDIHIPPSPPYRGPRDSKVPEAAPLLSKPSIDVQQDDVPMISGQLMIYELDEEPPITESLSNNRINIMKNVSSNINKEECILSRSGILGLSLMVSVIFLCLFTIILSLIIKIQKSRKEYNNLLHSKDSRIMYTPSESSYSSRDFLDSSYSGMSNDILRKCINTNNNRKFLTDFVVTKRDKNVY
ncbi:Zona pellucida domain-containing protein [Strongyloides ratti]|uniref:Zona pellucida domain-containing protein n=1 Tax=Strongyloides ratti TaxID=34506 RepID=A0A090L9R2_STRRB|nr:Zona pellucida domain-containing protein [Strongyloides ratti]CEF64878.1 Zona pellucida domain-containing protein [Strongyloides ratti]